MKIEIEMFEIPQLITTTKPNKYKIILAGVGYQEEVEAYFNYLKDNPRNIDIKETNHVKK